jgi:formylglycine-generating enzyme required for sulfatase activity
MAYCAWLSEQLGVEVRLPTETEWEKAARGKDGRICPWGNEFDAGRCNVRETGIGRTSAVGMFPLSKDGPWGEQTPLDMGGNVWERCSSWYAPYPYDADDGREIIDNIDNRTDYQYRVLRGGAFGSGKWFARAASRSGSILSLQYGYLGFRPASPFLFS